MTNEERKAALRARLDAMTPDERHEAELRLIGFLNCTCGESEACVVHPPPSPPDETVQGYLDAERIRDP
jgi:hypothetical protein